ncbi:50S ribosomal protein L18 [Candidatus Vallotia cooleyia]|uniref:50S ribosomal protein L18 n=1 Tax=Candidatus Vallotiella adelgis TaxID=1177211 RepID=UPI001D034AFF|nr:50S ribosomal protein L18 [Candidatus Vallotia cooleyia]UDG81869.1 50S ribosomal protein L18 [Candidatus Vallotia cooleyia]
MDKTQSRLRRARQTHIKISQLQVARLAVHRTNQHIYAQVFAPCGTKVVAGASTIEVEVRLQLANKSGKGGNTAAAQLVGKRIAEKAKAAGITSVAFDRSGFRYHGRVKALADAAREAGLKF